MEDSQIMTLYDRPEHKLYSRSFTRITDWSLYGVMHQSCGFCEWSVDYARSFSLMHTHTDAEAGSLKRSEADKVNSGYSISPCFQRWMWRSYLTEENKLIKAIQTKGQSTVSSRTRHKSDVHTVNRFTVKAKVEDAFHFYFSCAAFRVFFRQLIFTCSQIWNRHTNAFMEEQNGGQQHYSIHKNTVWLVHCSFSFCLCLHV